MTKKYELTDETKVVDGHTLHRIRARKDFKNVKAGDLGGWVESEKNLSQEGNCWVYDNAVVFENAEVRGNARVYEDALVRGHAEVFTSAKVYGISKVIENAKVTGKAKVFDYASVYGNAQVFGNAWVQGNSKVYGNAKVNGNARVSGNTEVYCEEEPKDREGMDYKKLEKNVMRHLDSMTDEELQADFDRHVERVEKWAKENPRAAEALGYDVPKDVKEWENMEDKKDVNLWETDHWKKRKPMLHKMWKEREEERRKRGELDDPEPTALANSPFPTREEIDELDRIGLAGVMKKRERQARWDAIWFWVMISLISICGGVVGTVLYRWLLG